MQNIIVQRKPVTVVSVEFVSGFDYEHPIYPFVPAQLQWQYNQYSKYKGMSSEQYSQEGVAAKFSHREWVDFELGSLVDACRKWNYLITDKDLVYGL